jgi:hypothetical protein
MHFISLSESFLRKAPGIIFTKTVISFSKAGKSGHGFLRVNNQALKGLVVYEFLTKRTRFAEQAFKGLFSGLRTT